MASMTIQPPPSSPPYNWPRLKTKKSGLLRAWPMRFSDCSRSIEYIRTKLSNFIWPGSVLTLGLTLGGVVAIRYSSLQPLQPLSRMLLLMESYFPLQGTMVPVCSCGGTGLVLFYLNVMFRRLSLRALLHYRAWMYEQRGKRAKLTVIWGLLVRLLSGGKPSLYSNQPCLPRIPVPPLSYTMDELLNSLQAIYSKEPEKLEEFKREAKEFQRSLGPKLQRALVLRSWWVDNYIGDWWEKYVYLMTRSALTINSNYYIMDHGYWTPTTLQCARAAGVLYQILVVWEQIQMEQLEPLVIQTTVPVCMAQYRRVLSTCRVPGEEMDELVHYPMDQAQHIVVSRRGLFYKVDVVSENGRLINATALEKQFEWIIEDADAKYMDVPEMERSVAALTALDRTTWAKARKEFLLSGVNKETLHWVESAVLFLVLDTESFTELSDRAAHLLHGSVGLFWFDKSVELISMSDGHVGMNCEHSFADAPVVAHIFEHNLTYEVLSDHYNTGAYSVNVEAVNVRPGDRVLSRLYDKDGHCIDVRPGDPAVKKPTPLQWEMSPGLEAAIQRACNFSEKNIKDLDLVLYDNTEFGKGHIKQCKVSPDAFIQMALHSTFRKLEGRPALTYEASMTRLYKHGRTETVRSMTPEANSFVESFLDTNSKKEVTRALLQKACERHALMYKDAMNGKGIDRHLFALYVVSRGMGTDCEFLKKVLSIPWTLSTSQQPQQQIAWTPGCSDPQYQKQICPGGGFGPVAADGYGVSYMVPGDHRIFFHVSSRHFSADTNSMLFMNTLRATLLEMKALFET